MDEPWNGPRWEYFFVLGKQITVIELNSIGRSGWELVLHTGEKGGYVFKRPLPAISKVRIVEDDDDLTEEGRAQIDAMVVLQDLELKDLVRRVIELECEARDREQTIQHLQRGVAEQDKLIRKLRQASVTTAGDWRNDYASYLKQIDCLADATMRYAFRAGWLISRGLDPDANETMQEASNSGKAESEL